MRRLAIVFLALATLLVYTPGPAQAEVPFGLDVNVGKIDCYHDRLRTHWSLNNSSDQTATISLQLNGRTVLPTATYYAGENNSGDVLDGSEWPFGLNAGQAYTLTALVNGEAFDEARGIAPACKYGLDVKVGKPRCASQRAVVRWSVSNNYSATRPVWIQFTDRRSIMGLTEVDPRQVITGTVDLGKFWKPGDGYTIFYSRDGTQDGRTVSGTVPDCRNGAATKYPRLLVNPIVIGRQGEGFGYVGEVLTALPGRWNPTPESSAFQWYRRSVRAGTGATATKFGPWLAIDAATSDTYTPGPADTDTGHQVMVREYVTATGYSPAAANSALVRIYSPLS